MKPAITAPDRINRIFDEEERRMRESKKRTKVETERPAKRWRTASGAAAGLNKQQLMRQQGWEAKCAEL